MDVQIGVVGLTTSIVADAKKLIMDAYRMQRSNEYITGDYVPNRSETTSIITDNAPPLEFYSDRDEKLARRAEWQANKRRYRSKINY